MLYTLAHVIKNKAPWIWSVSEDLNAFVFRMMKAAPLKRLGGCCADGVRLATLDDAGRLAKFFSEQPEESYKWFRPHRFDEASVRRLLKTASYIIYVQEEDGDIIGYAFLRSFCNGKCFLGKMVDGRHQGKGVCTTLCRVGMRMATVLGMKMYESINEANVGSMKASQKACEVTLVEKLKDGDVLIEDRRRADDAWYADNGYSSE